MIAIRYSQSRAFANNQKTFWTGMYYDNSRCWNKNWPTIDAFSSNWSRSYHWENDI